MCVNYHFLSSRTEITESSQVEGDDFELISVNNFSSKIHKADYYLFESNR